MKAFALTIHSLVVVRDNPEPELPTEAELVVEAQNSGIPSAIEEANQVAKMASASGMGSSSQAVMV